MPILIAKIGEKISKTFSLQNIFLFKNLIRRIANGYTQLKKKQAAAAVFKRNVKINL